MSDSNKTVNVEVWSQDPFVARFLDLGKVEIKIPNHHLESGPKDAQLAVLDHDFSSNALYQPVKFDQLNNKFVGTVSIQFHQLNAFAIARYALDMIERSIGRQVHWAFGPQLTIYPHIAQGQNAFYSRPMGALGFLYFDVAFEETKVFTCESHDIVAHELGHAALDGLKPYYFSQVFPETGAFHESFGDIIAMFSTLSLQEVVNHVMRSTNGDLTSPSVISLLAEEFGYGMGGLYNHFLRYAGDSLVLSELRSFEVHDYSVLLTATLYEILVNFYEINRQTMTDVEALIEAANHLRRIACRAINYLPPTFATFKRYGQAMIAADKRVFPEDALGYRNIIKDVFKRREIIKAHDELESTPRIDLEWDGITDQRGVYEFIYRNRKELGIPSGPQVRLNYPTINFVDLSSLTSEGAVPIQETLIEYSYSIPVWVPRYGYFQVNFGGTMVFDPNHQLVAYFVEPEEPGGEQKMLAQIIEFIEELDRRQRIKLVDLDGDVAQTFITDDATYLVQRLPNGNFEIQLNLYSCFRQESNSMFRSVSIL